MSESQLCPKVLIVDDRPENLVALKRLLKPLQVEVVEADSGEAALAQVLRHNFAVILLDVQMPVMDGFETAQLIRAHKSTEATPIIFVTAISKEDKHVAMGYKSGAVDYLYKPINPDILLGKVKVFLELEHHRLEMKNLTEQLQETNKTNELLLSSAGEGIIGITIEGLVQFVNPAATELMQIDEQALMGQSIFPWFYEPGIDDFVKGWADNHQASAIYQETCYIRRQNNDGKPIELNLSPMRNSRGKITGGVLMFRDITERLQLEENLRQMAQYDTLTGLANRRLFLDYLQASVARTQRRKCMTAVLFLDLDHFKQINDTLGHDVGDDLLISVAERLRNCVRDGDLIARLGGDEFAIVLDDIVNEEDVKFVANRIVESVSQPHELAGRDLQVSTSVGIATSSACGQDVTELVKAADTAMYVTKKAGRHGFRFFTQDMQDECQRRIEKEQALRTAVSAGQFELAYQPIVALDSGQVLAYETQLNWPYHDSLVAQEEFLPEVQSLRLMNELGGWTLDSVGLEVSSWCGDNQERQQAIFSINLHADQCKNIEVVTLIEKMLAKHGLAPAQLELSISERVVGDICGKLIAALNRLREQGVHVALDNFGSGVSALSYLRKLPVDVIKIDQLYIREIGRDPRAESILKALSGLAREMGIRAVAKGVESSDQLQFLTDLGYDQAQGPLLGGPQSIKQIESCVLDLPTKQ